MAQTDDLDGMFLDLPDVRSLTVALGCAALAVVGCAAGVVALIGMVLWSVMR